MLRALEIFAADGRSDFLPVADRLLRRADPEIRAAALRARTRVAPEEMPLRAADADPSPLVRATALAGLVAGGWAGDDGPGQIESLLADGGAEAEEALARAIAQQPSPAFEAVLLRLAESPSENVLVHAAQGHGRAAQPALPARAARHARAARRPGRGARGAARLRRGGAGLPRRGARRPRAADRAAPAPAAHDRRCSRRAEAAAVLERHVLEETSGAVRYRILRALNRLASSPDVVLDVATLRRGAERHARAPSSG